MASAFQTDTDILIVGAGPTGLALACELQRRGIAHRIFDKKTHLSTASKASNIQPRSLEQLHFLGLKDKILAKSDRLTGQNVYIGNKKVSHIKLGHLPIEYPYILIIPQSDTEKVLHDHLLELGGRVDFGTELFDFAQDENRVQVRYINQHNTVDAISCKYLVSCEGAHSKVRKLSNILFQGRTYEEEFLLADLEIDWDYAPKDTHAWFHKEGLFIALPLPYSKQWRIFADFKIQKRKGQKVPKASLDILQEVFYKRTQGLRYKLHSPTWMSNFKINRRMVKQYRKGRLFLAGDAAHIHSPFGGQGMNTSIQDAFNLAWKLALVCKDQAPDELLDTYEAERLPIAKNVLSRTDFNSRVLFPDNSLIRLVRDHLATKALAMDKIQQRVLTRISQLNVRYKNSSLSINDLSSSAYQAFKKQLSAGERSPQISIKNSSLKTATSIFDLFQSTKFTLLVFCQQIKDFPHFIHDLQQTEITNQVFMNTFIITDHADLAQQIATHQLPTYICNAKDFKTYANANPSLLCLVRPDGYIGFLSDQLNWKGVNDYFSSVLRLKATPSVMSSPEKTSNKVASIGQLSPTKKANQLT